MNELNLFLAESNENFKIVKVKFNDTTSKTYTYKTLLDVYENDKAVVDVNGVLKIVDVIEVLNAQETSLDFNFEIKWLVDVVDITSYEDTKEMSRNVTKTINRLRYSKARKELIKELNDELGKKNVEDIKKLVRL